MGSISWWFKNLKSGVMLRKRSRVMTSKQALMADNGSIPSPTSGSKQIRPISSFFNSPKFFTGFSVKGVSETESVMSPTSILDNKPFTSLGNPFWHDRNTTSTRLSVESCIENNKHHPWEKNLDSKGLVDALNEVTDTKSSKPDSRMVVFGSQLKIQIPCLPHSGLSPSDSPRSPADFGIKTRNSPAVPSPCLVMKSQFGSANSGHETPVSPSVFTGCLSASEMELSEDYTCVIARGPNPRTTRIFGDCIVENCCGAVGSPRSGKKNCKTADPPSYPSEKFLSFCYNCKKDLVKGRDIYMYRGEKAFCSRECRYKEMLFDEGQENSELVNPFATRS